MKLFWKILGLAVAMAALSLVLFGLWGDTLEQLFSQERCAAWFAESRSYAWALAVGLLVSDLVLPVPATGIMAALGHVYGVLLGALIGAIGSALSGLIGYLLARLAGRRLTRFLASDEELERFRGFFDRWGGGAIIISRGLPILPEVLSVLAGLGKMNVMRFVASLLMGTIPTALLYSWLGEATRDLPWYGLLLALALPLLLWPLFLRVVMGRPASGMGSS